MIKPNANKPSLGALRLLRDSGGNILPMTAAGIVVLAGLVGGGVDVSRAYMVQNRLQSACDAGALAGRRAVSDNGFTTAAQNRATDYFNTNFDAGEAGVSNTVFTPSSPDNGNTVVGNASATLDTTVMAIFNYDAMPLSVTCSASMSVGNSDIMMILDTTGSMDWNLGATGEKRIDALEDAMKNFYDTVATATAGSNARVRYGFVPYSSSVNVGQMLYDTNPDYLADEAEYPSKEPVFEEVTVDTVTGYEDPVVTTDTSTSSSWNGWWSRDTSQSWRRRNQCRAEEPEDTDWADHGGSHTNTSTTVNSAGQQVVTETTVQQQRRTQYTCGRRSGRWYVYYRTQYRNQEDTIYSTSDPIVTSTTSTVFKEWVYKDVTYDTSTYKTFASSTVPLGTDGTDISYTWNGCIQERETEKEDEFTWSSLTGLDPSGALDLDIDGAPNSSDADTQWKPMWPEVSYRRYTSSSRNYYSSASESAYGSLATSRCPVAARNFATMTETEFDTYAESLDPEGSTYHSIGMIWGARLASPDGIFASNVNAVPPNGGAVARHIIFMTDGIMDTSYSAQTAWGMEYWDRRVTDDGYSDQDDRHVERFKAACEIAKSKGIRLWVIAFDTALTADLVDCASDESSFLASNADQLNQAFQEIAKDVGELRITQ